MGLNYLGRIKRGKGAAATKIGIVLTQKG